MRLRSRWRASPVRLILNTMRHPVSITPTSALFFMLIGFAWASAARAQNQTPPFSGVWSRNERSCALSKFEDETRITIRPPRFDGYLDQCVINSTSSEPGGSFLLYVNCGQPQERDSRLVRILLRNTEEAVFYDLFERGKPSRNLIRCTERTSSEGSPIEDAEATDAVPDGTIAPKLLIRDWLKENRRCFFEPHNPKVDEACEARKRDGKTLKMAGFCHYAQRRHEGWRRCR